MKKLLIIVAICFLFVGSKTAYAQSRVPLFTTFSTPVDEVRDETIDSDDIPTRNFEVEQRELNALYAEIIRLLIILNALQSQ